MFPMFNQLGMSQNEDNMRHPFLHRMMHTGGALPPMGGYDSSGINPGGMYTGGPMQAHPFGMSTGGNLPPQQMGGMQTGGNLPAQSAYGGWLGQLMDWGRANGGRSY
jgi:hypothetical protein